MIVTILGSSPPCACSWPGWTGAAAGTVTSTNAKPSRPRTTWPDRLVYQGVRDISIFLHSAVPLAFGTAHHRRPTRQTHTLVRPHARRTSGPAADTSPAHPVEARHRARDPLLMGGRRSGGWHERSGHPLRQAVQAEREQAGDDAVHDRVDAN